MLTLNNTAKTVRQRPTESGTAHISQIGKLERPIRTKFDTKAYILTLNNTTKIIVIGSQGLVPLI